MDHKQIKQLKKQAQAEKRRLSKLMNSASPGADWCGTFLKALEDDRVQSVSEAEQQTVRSWAARIEALRSAATANKSLEKLPLTDADKQLRVEVQLVQAKFPKHALTAVLKNTDSKPLEPTEPIKKAAAPAAAPAKEVKSKNNANSGGSDGEDDIADLKPEGMSASEWKKLKRKARKKERQARKAEKKQKEKGGDGDDNDKKQQKKKSKTQAEKDELAEDRRGAKYAAAGMIAYAVRRRALAASAKGNPNEIVVLMICEKREKQVLNLPGGKVRMSEDHNDSNLTALREFSEETKLIWEYDMAAMEHRMRSEAPDLGLTRCMQQDGGYYLHFTQIPYIPNANKLLAEKKGVKLSAGGGQVAADNTTGLFWVPLKTLLRAAKLKSIEVTVHPGTTPPVFRRISLHRFVPELFRNRRIMEKVKLLHKLFAEGKIKALPMPDFAQPDVPDEQQPEQPEDEADGSDNAEEEKSDNESGSDSESESESGAEESGNDKKRKRDEMEETDEVEAEAETDSKPAASNNGPSDIFGSLSSNKLDLDRMDWDTIVGTVIESRTGGKGTLTAKGPLKKIVLQDLSKQVRSRLYSMLDGQLAKRTQYIIENGQIGPRPKKQKVE